MERGADSNFHYAQTQTVVPEVYVQQSRAVLLLDCSALPSTSAAKPGRGSEPRYAVVASEEGWARV